MGRKNADIARYEDRVKKQGERLKAVSRQHGGDSGEAARAEDALMSLEGQLKALRELKGDY